MNASLRTPSLSFGGSNFHYQFGEDKSIKCNFLTNLFKVRGICYESTALLWIFILMCLTFAQQTFLNLLESPKGIFVT